MNPTPPQPRGYPRPLRPSLVLPLVVVLAVFLVAARADAPAEFSRTYIPIYLDASPAVEDAARRAQELYHQGRLPESARLYQQLIENHHRSLVSSDTGVIADARDLALTRLKADPDLLQTYRLAYSADAQRELDEAQHGAQSQLSSDINKLPLPNDPLGLSQQAQALEDVLGRFGLCPAGFEAGLRLAGVYLESAQFDRAQSVLDQLGDLPDLPPHQARWLQLQAVTALYDNRAYEALQRYKALSHLGPTQDDVAQLLEQLQLWTANLRPAASPANADPFASELKAQPDSAHQLPPVLWTRRLSELARSPENPNEESAQGRVHPSQLSKALFSPVLPVSVGRRLYINTTTAIISLDATSGRPIWARPTLVSLTTAQWAYWLSRPNRTFSSLLVQDGKVIASTAVGTVYPSWQYGEEAGGSALVCLDAEDGTPRWRLEPGQVAEKLEGTRFIDTPIGAADRVYALTRRAQRNNFEDLYLVCVSVSTGQPLWWRHLSSAAQAGGGLRQVTMTLDGARLYVGDNLGLVACLDARDGAMHWLSILEDRPDKQRIDTAADHANMSVRQPSPPVPTEAGLLISPFIGQSTARLLDPRTGAVLRVLKGGVWGSESYIESTPGGLLLIGSTVQLLDPGTFEPRWTTTLSFESKTVPVGRAAIAGDRLWVCLPTRLVVVNLSDGQVLNDVPIGVPGSVLTLGREVILCGLEAIRGHIGHDLAYSRIRDEIDRGPDDVRPALALAQAGLAADDAGVAIEGFDAAIRALRAQPATVTTGDATAVGVPETGLVPLEELWDADFFPGVWPKGTTTDQELVFEELLTAAEEPRVGAVDLRRRLFERLAATTAGPADEVAYHLAVAQFLAQISQPGEAVDHYQTILIEPTLSAQRAPNGYGAFQAQSEAQWQLARLIQQHGPKVYSRYEALAEATLQQILSRGYNEGRSTIGPGAKQPPESPESPGPPEPPDPSVLSGITDPLEGPVVPLQPGRPGGSMIEIDPGSLVELARQYPLATAAARALLAAAHVVHQRGDVDGAIAHLRRAYRMTQAPRTAGAVIGSLAQLYQAKDQPQQAVNWLRRAHRDYPDLQFTRRGVAVTADQWIAQLTSDPRSELRLPRLALPLEAPFAVPGRLMVPTHQAREAWLKDAILTQEDVRVQLRRGPRFEAVWEAYVPFPHAQLLSLTKEQAVFWFEEASTLLALDTQTGQPMWPLLNLPELARGRDKNAAGPLEENRRIGGVRLQVRGGARVRVRTTQRFQLALDDMTIAVADERTGWAAGFDRYSGQRVWQFDTRLRPLRKITAQHGLVAIAGLRSSRSGPSRRQGVVVLLDAFTGRRKAPLIDEAQNFFYLSIPRPNLVLYATHDRLVARDPNDGQMLWWNATDDQMYPALSAVNRDTLLMASGRFYNAVLALDLMTGKINHAVPSPTGLSNPLDLQAYFAPDGTGTVLTPYRLAAVDPSGGLLWQDAVYNGEYEKKYVLSLVADSAVALLAVKGQSLPRQIVLNGQVFQIPPGNAPGRRVQGAVPERGPEYVLYILDRATGRIVAEHGLGPLPVPIDPSSALAVDDALVFTTSTDTIIIPTPGTPTTGTPAPGSSAPGSHAPGSHDPGSPGSS